MAEFIPIVLWRDIGVWFSGSGSKAAYDYVDRRAYVDMDRLLPSSPWIMQSLDTAAKRYRWGKGSQNAHHFLARSGRERHRRGDGWIREFYLRMEQERGGHGVKSALQNIPNPYDVQVGRGYHQLNPYPYPYPPKPYPVRVGYKHRAGKPAVSNLRRVV
ncbi:hypothetical protein B0H14DRAFT_2562323 [Mycena olivaceomarginata]|nr:hypothetical protein B0H14DRAFT_2562323 [Mycena olivaceomarginata]